MRPVWKPLIQKGDKPIFMALLRALSGDIAAGRLPQGSRLPPQRELADELKIAIGTVTRVYAEAEKRGLVYGDGRRGTFVGSRSQPRSLLASMAENISAGIDLSKNHPAHWLDPDLTIALNQIARWPDCRQLLLYPPPEGMPSHRLAAARWLKQLGLETKPENLFVAGGVQHALMAVFASETRPGDIIVAEEYTYPGVRAVADMLGLQQLGVPMDDEGMIPEALESVCRNKDVRLLYCNPSLQNPTNAMMSPERRKQIAAIAENYNICVVEDEILSPLLDERPGYITDIIPQRCFFVISVSKAVAAGLRVGFIAAPPSARQKLIDTLQAISLGMPPLMAEIFARWYEDGTVEKTIGLRKRELVWAHQTACEVLHGFEIKSHPSSYHLWLMLPDGWTSQKFATEAQMRGVAVTPADIFAVEGKAGVNAVRLSIGSAPSREHLKTALEIIAAILSGSKRADTVRV